MKNTLNTKKILKATIAFSGILLFGCAPVSENGVDYYEEDTQYVNYEPDQGRTADDRMFYDDEDMLVLTDEDLSDDYQFVIDGNTEENGFENEPIVIADEQISVAASTPAKPRAVPAKPEENCPKCKKAAATPTVAETAQVEETQIEAATPTVAETAQVEETQIEEAPVANKGAEIVIIDEPDNFVVLDNTVDENIVVDVQEDDEAKLRAERDRLQKELESLTAEKRTLEDEKVRVTQIQQSNTEACDEVKDWVASEGTTLRTLLTDWGNHVGWRVVWNMDRDYTLEAGAIFRGRFVEVASALLRSFARAVPAPKGVFYKGNKVLVVSTREDENAD